MGKYFIKSVSLLAFLLAAIMCLVGFVLAIPGIILIIIAAKLSETMLDIGVWE